MKLKSWAIQKYWSVPYQSFTEKIIEALGIFKMFPELDTKDVKRIEYLRENTHETIKVPIYKIDRIINPTKGQFNPISNKIKFLQNDQKEHPDEPYIELTEDQMQYYCCLAIEEVHCIVLDNIKNYAEEMPIPMPGDDESVEEFAQI